MVEITVVKASGEMVPFEPERLRRSLRHAGADPEAVKGIEKEIRDILYPGITTKAIYRAAFAMLKKVAPHMASRYKLKKAIYELGPTGFPFEKYVGEILKEEGYSVQIDQLVNGRCVQHEVDVVAEKEDRHFMIECKFHSDQGRKCDVKVPLYIHSRFRDVEKAWKRRPGHSVKFHQGWLVTNTRFTSDAIDYGTCVGLNMVSWDFPQTGSLKERINRAGLHPVTCLTTLTGKEKHALLDRGIVLCKELCRNENWIKEDIVSSKKIKKVLEEARLLCRLKIAA